MAAGLLLNMLNVCADVHPVVLRIMSSGISLAFALKAVAALVLGVVKTEDEISESFKMCGCTKLINSCFSLFCRGFVPKAYHLSV